MSIIIIPPKPLKRKAGPAKLCFAYNAEGDFLARRRTLRAMLVFVSEYAKPCTVKTPAGRILFLNQKEGY